MKTLFAIAAIMLDRPSENPPHYQIRWFAWWLIWYWLLARCTSSRVSTVIYHTDMSCLSVQQLLPCTAFSNAKFS